MSGSKSNNQQQILNAGLWAAVSSLPQAKLVSLDDQLSLGREHAARHGCRIVAEFVVPGESRDIVLFEEASRRMEAYRQLGEAIEKHTIDVLIFLDRSRLGRQAALSMAVVGLCAKEGILIYDMESPPASLDQLRQSQATYDDQLLGAIKSVGAQREIEKMKFRQASGMIGRTKRGLMPGKLNYGYTARYEADGTIVYEVDSAAAAVIRQICDLYLSGAGCHSIAYMLTEQGATSPSGRSTWSHAMIVALLDKIWRYAGFAELNRRSAKGRPYVKAKGAWPAIIDETTVEAIVAERKARKQNRKLVGTHWKLAGVVYCMTCGMPMNICRQSPATRHLYDTMRCYRHTPGTYVSYREALAFAEAAIQSLQDTDLSTLEQHAPPAGRLNRQEAALEKQLEEIEAATLRADDQFVAGRMTPERYQRQLDALAERKAKVELDLAAVHRERERQGDREERRKRLATAKEFGVAMWNNPDVAAVNAWLRRLMRLWVAENEVRQIDWIV